MAKVIGHRDPKLRLSYFEVITLKRLAEHARKKEEEEVAAQEERLASHGDIVELGGHTYRRTEWILDSREKIAELDEIIAALTECKHRTWVNLSRPGTKRGGGESCMKSCSSPRNGEPS